MFTLKMLERTISSYCCCCYCYYYYYYYYYSFSEVTGTSFSQDRREHHTVTEGHPPQTDPNINLDNFVKLHEV